YSFRADRWNKRRPELLWKFDGNPKDSVYRLGGRSSRLGIIAIPVIYDGLVYLAMGEDPEHGEGPGHLWCIEPTKRGDVSPDLVVDEDGETVPHRRLQAANAWDEILFLEPKDGLWERLEDLQLPEFVRTAFRKIGMKLPDAVQLKSVSLGTEWLMDAEV